MSIHFSKLGSDSKGLALLFYLAIQGKSWDIQSLCNSQLLCRPSHLGSSRGIYIKCLNLRDGEAKVHNMSKMCLRLPPRIAADLCEAASVISSRSGYLKKTLSGLNLHRSLSESRQNMEKSILSTEYTYFESTHLFK